MKKVFLFFGVLIGLFLFNQQTYGQFNYWPHKINNGIIELTSPSREVGQQHALGLTVPKMDVVRVAFVGLGMRGPGAVERW